MFVQFADSTQTVIVSYFGAPQDESEFPNQGAVDASDARYKTFFNSLPQSATPGMPVPT